MFTNYYFKYQDITVTIFIAVGINLVNCVIISNLNHIVSCFSSYTKLLFYQYYIFK